MFSFGKIFIVYQFIVLALPSSAQQKQGEGKLYVF